VGIIWQGEWRNPEYRGINSDLTAQFDANGSTGAMYPAVR
jgi:hypothetical protein